MNSQELEKIIQRWMKEEQVSREIARELAIMEIDFYYQEENGKIWQGSNDSYQEYL